MARMRHGETEGKTHMGILESFSLAGRKALVTGAGRGIGRCLSQALAEAGADLTAVDIDADTARKAADEIGALGVKTLAIQADVTKPDAVQNTLDQHLKAMGRIDVVINNAGICVHVPAEEMTLKQWDDVMELNLRGLFLVAQAAGRQMITQKSGSIINIASMSGSIVNTPQPQAAYNTSKAGVIMLTKSLAAEWAPKGVRVNSISPGYTKTEMAMQEHVKPFHPKWTGLIPMGRMAEVKELAGAAVYLASDASSYMTGHDLVVDGGYTAW